MKQDAIMSLLETCKPTVFKTRTIPRLAPHRQLDLDITEEEGARPVAARPYPVAPQHLPELNQQIAALERYHPTQSQPLWRTRLVCTKERWKTAVVY